MIAARSEKSTGANEQPATEFEIAQAAYREVRTAYNALEKKRSAADAALSTLRLPESEFKRCPKRLTLGREFIQQTYGDEPPKADRLDRFIVDLLDELGDELSKSNNKLRAARQAFVRAADLELSRIVVTEFFPRHADVLRKIDKAAKALKDALTEEEILRSDLTIRWPHSAATDRLLNSAAALGLGSLGRWSAGICAWIREVEKRGLL